MKPIDNIQPMTPKTEAELISVIIPCFNSSEFLSYAIDSALEQSYPNKEVVVVDDGSTDDSAMIAATYKDKIAVVHQNNAGVSAARNAGISATSGKYLAFLDADDYWHKDFLLELAQALEKSNAGIAYCGWENTGLTGGRGKPFIPPDYEADPDKLAKLISSVRWPVHATLMRRSICEEIGGFNPLLESCEDFALWIRAATAHKLILVPKVLAFYRHHGDQMTKNRAKVISDHIEVQEEFLQGHPEIENKLGRDRIRDLLFGELLHKGYESYWQRDFKASRFAFRRVLWAGYFSATDLIYILPALLPLRLHKLVVRLFERIRNK